MSKLLLTCSKIQLDGEKIEIDKEPYIILKSLASIHLDVQITDIVVAEV